MRPRPRRCPYAQAAPRRKGRNRPDLPAAARGSGLQPQARCGDAPPCVWAGEDVRDGEDAVRRCACVSYRAGPCAGSRVRVRVKVRAVRAVWAVWCGVGRSYGLREGLRGLKTETSNTPPPRLAGQGSASDACCPSELSLPLFIGLSQVSRESLSQLSRSLCVLGSSRRGVGAERAGAGIWNRRMFLVTLELSCMATMTERRV